MSVSSLRWLLVVYLILLAAAAAGLLFGIHKPPAHMDFMWFLPPLVLSLPVGAAAFLVEPVRQQVIIMTCGAVVNLLILGYLVRGKSAA